MPVVIDVRRTGHLDPTAWVYVGRPSKWGNPFEIGRDGAREEVVAKYREWVVKQPRLMAALREIAGKDLACWCIRRPCHAEVLIKLANHSADTE
jgi:hypothetical protein